VFPVSVALAAACTRDFGPAPFFVFGGVTLALAILGGLTQGSWRELGTNPGAPPAAESPLATVLEGKSS
jgi:hypothetical protein